MKFEYATYQASPSTNGQGTFYLTDCCGNKMYSVRGPEAYHGVLCPRCFWNGKHVTLYMRGTKEANELFENGYVPKMRYTYG